MKNWLFLALIVTAFGVVSSVVVYDHREDWLPEMVPTHWGIDGQPDAFTPRDKLLPTLFIMPGVMVLMIGLGYALPWLSPGKFTIEPFRPTFEYIMAVVVVMFGYLHLIIVLGYMGVVDDVGKWLIGGSLLCLAAMGNVLGKVKRNFYVGIKTPWTLASDQVWDRTHRLGAWLFVAGGLVGSALVFLGVNPILAMSAFGVAAIVPVFYSLWLYKRLEKQGQLGDPQ